MTVYNLMLDFETSGLDPLRTFVLECGWTVTDEAFTQLTPLRSRFLCISTGSSRLEVADAQRSAFWSALQPQVVREMHQKSKLSRDYMAAPSFAVVGSEVELDRLLFDDLARAGVKSSDTVHLAGLGVGHFDRQVLDAMGSEVAAQTLHHRAADISAATQVLGITVKTTEDLVGLVATVAELSDHSFSLHDLIALQTDETTERLVKSGTSILDFEKVVSHRAADDVAFGLVLARALQASTRRLSNISV